VCRAIGATVVGTAGTKDGMDVVTKCGAHHVFNHNHKSYEKKMVEHLGTGFDVIIEHLANINLGHDLQMLKEGARVMVVGCRGSVNINPRHLMMPEASIRCRTSVGLFVKRFYYCSGSCRIPVQIFSGKIVAEPDPQH
jgi:NADPH2:quinone reductase